MSDFSKVLGQVYAHADEGSVSPVAAVAPGSEPVYGAGPSTPEWADDAHLDQAFANWSPGPPPEAPAAERRFAANLPAPREPAAGERVVIDGPSGPLEDDLAAALSAALASAAPDNGVDMHASPEPAPALAEASFAPTPVAYPDLPSTPEAYPPLPDTALSMSSPAPVAPTVSAAAAAPAAPVAPAGPGPSPQAALPAAGDHAFAWIDGSAPTLGGLTPTAVVPPIAGVWDEVGHDIPRPQAEPEAAPQRLWQRSDDDILPRRGGRSRKSKGGGQDGDGVVAGAVIQSVAVAGPANGPAKKRFALGRKR